MTASYSEDNIRTLDWQEHIRRRPGMYIGKLGDGSSADDGIYILIKEVVDNSIDEFMMGFGKEIIIDVTDESVRIRDYGRGIPLGKVVDVASKINTGGKYDSNAFQKSVGLNGVGMKAVNALSSQFSVQAFREKKSKRAVFEEGVITLDEPEQQTEQANGTEVIFTPDKQLFGNFHYISEYIETMVRNYTYLNAGLVINFNGTKYISKNGLFDLLNDNMSDPGLYNIIHIKGEDIELALTHNKGNSNGL